MNNISAVGSVPSSIISTNFVSRINWRLAGKISLIAVGVFLLAATLLCIGVRYSLRNELTPLQREHSQPLTEERRQEWLRRARAYIWPELTAEDALVAANNALVPREGDSLFVISSNAPSVYGFINNWLNRPAFQANPQQDWNQWRLLRGDDHSLRPDDSAARFFEQELGFTTSPAFEDRNLLRNYRYYRDLSDIDTSFSARAKAQIRTCVRRLFGMS